MFAVTKGSPSSSWIQRRKRKVQVIPIAQCTLQHMEPLDEEEEDKLVMSQSRNSINGDKDTSLKSIPSSDSMATTVDEDDKPISRCRRRSDGLLAQLLTLFHFQISSRSNDSTAASPQNSNKIKTSQSMDALDRLRLDTQHKHALLRAQKMKSHQNQQQEQSLQRQRRLSKHFKTIQDIGLLLENVPEETSGSYSMDGSSVGVSTPKNSRKRAVCASTNLDNSLRCSSFEDIVSRLNILYCGEGERSRSNCEVLKRREHLVFFASNEEDAVRLLRGNERRTFDMIVVEMDSSTFDGKKLLQKLKEVHKASACASCMNKHEPIVRSFSFEDSLDSDHYGEERQEAVMWITTSFSCNDTNDVYQHEEDCLFIASPYSYQQFIQVIYEV